MTTRALDDALLAATVLGCQITQQLMAARLGVAGTPLRTQWRLDIAVARAKELVTRLECARDLYAATPLAERPS